MSNDYNTTEAGRLLHDRMKAVLTGQVITDDSPKTDQPKTAEYSAGIAEKYGAIVGKPSFATITAAKKTADTQRKNYRKWAIETAKSTHDAVQAYFATLKPPAGTSAHGTWKGKRFVVTTEDMTAEAERSVTAIIDMIARAPDEDLLEESLKKGRSGQTKRIADLDPKKYSEGEYIDDGGNEWYQGTAYTGVLVYDTGGVMNGLVKLLPRGTRALDRKDITNAGGIYATLIGDTPFRKDEEGNGTKWIKLSPKIVDDLFKARFYLLCAEALKTKIQELDKMLKGETDAEKAEAIETFTSGVFDGAVDKMQREAAITAAKDASKGVELDLPTAGNVTKVERLRNELALEQKKGDRANQKRLNGIYKQAATEHPDYAERALQAQQGILPMDEWEKSEIAYGQQVLAQ